MGPVFFVMALMGCGDGMAGCSEARLAPTHYATIAQCRADQANVIARNTDIDYPVIGAACRASGPVIASTAPVTRG